MLKTYKPFVLDYVKTTSAIKMLYADNIVGEVSFVTLYSINRNSEQVDLNSLGNNEIYKRKYTKIHNYPLFNLNRAENTLAFDFDADGYTTDNHKEPINFDINKNIFNLQIGDVFVFADLETTYYYRVDKQESVENRNNKHLQIKKLTAVVIDAEDLDDDVENTFEYSFVDDKLYDSKSLDRESAILELLNSLITKADIGSILNSKEYRFKDETYTFYSVFTNKYHLVDSRNIVSDLSSSFEYDDIESIDIHEIFLSIDVEQPETLLTSIANVCLLLTDVGFPLEYDVYTNTIKGVRNDFIR